MSKKIDINESIFKKIYKENKNVSKVAHIFNVSISFVYQYINKHNIQRYKHNMTEEQKYFLSEWRKKYFENPENREKNRKIQIEVQNKPEYILKKREISKGLWQDIEYKKKTINAMKIKFNTPEYKRKNSESKKRYFKNIENREKISKILIEIGKKPEVKLKRSISAKNRTSNPEWKISHGEKIKKWWANPKNKNRMVEISKKLWQTPEHKERCMKVNNKKPNGIESKIIKLNIDGIKYVGNRKWYRWTGIKYRNPDFKITGQNKVIELFGNYWHKGKNPNDLINEYKSIGIDCIIFWESEVKNDIEKVKKNIIEFRDKPFQLSLDNIQEIKELILI